MFISNANPRFMISSTFIVTFKYKYSIMIAFCNNRILVCNFIKNTTTTTDDDNNISNNNNEWTYYSNNGFERTIQFDFGIGNDFKKCCYFFDCFCENMV